MSKNHLPPLSNRWGASGVSRAQKRRGWNNVPDFLQALLSLYKPMQRIASAKIQHAHSCLIRSICKCAPTPVARVRKQEEVRA
jgi:hypothetical protein